MQRQRWKKYYWSWSLAIWLCIWQNFRVRLYIYIYIYIPLYLSLSHWTTINKVNFFSLGVYDGRLPPPGRCSLTFELNCFKRILPQSRTFPYTTFCLHTLLRQTYARSNPRFFFSFRLPYALLSLAKTVTPFNYTAQATVIGRH